MKQYFIYLIAGIKIGCTLDLIKRMREQGFTDWEILEVHTDGWLAGDRELELQKQYGLPIDKVHYMIALQNREIGAAKGRSKIQSTRTKEEHAAISKLGYEAGGKAWHVAGGRATKGIPKPQATVACPHCPKEGGNSLMKRYHFDNCKHNNNE